MSVEVRPRAAAGSAMAAWSAKALLITVGVFLVGGAIWYARAATVPLIVAALISTQLLPLIELATRRGMSRGLAVAASLLGVVVIGVGLAWVFTHALFGNLGGVGEDISEGAEKVVAWLGDNNDWVEQHDDAIHDFLRSILPAAKDAAGGVLEGALGALSLAAQLVSGALHGARVPPLSADERRRRLGLAPGLLQPGPPRSRRRCGPRRLERRERLHPRH